MRGERHEWMTVDIHTNLVTDFCNTICQFGLMHRSNSVDWYELNAEH